MPTDEDLHAHFAAHGWAVVRGVVPAARLAELEQAVDTLFAAWPPTSTTQVWELPGASRAAPTIALHTHDPAVARHAALALGCDGVQLLQDTVLVKPAHGAATVAWHQDHTYTGYLRPSHLATIRLSLTECTRDNGCLEVIDASHLNGPAGEVRALSESHIADALGGQAATLADRIVPIELAPGDLSIHHCLTFHRSGQNRTAHARKTLITRLFDARCLLDPALLPPGAATRFPVDPTGHLARSAFPLLWGRS